jgi:hypothetical protein
MSPKFLMLSIVLALCGSAAAEENVPPLEFDYQKPDVSYEAKYDYVREWHVGKDKSFTIRVREDEEDDGSITIEDKQGGRMITRRVNYRSGRDYHTLGEGKDAVEVKGKKVTGGFSEGQIRQLWKKLNSKKFIKPFEKHVAKAQRVSQAMALHAIH